MKKEIEPSFTIKINTAQIIQYRLQKKCIVIYVCIQKGQ